MQITIEGILYETAVMHEAHDTHTIVLIPVGSDKTLSELAQEGKILLCPQDLLEKEKEI